MAHHLRLRVPYPVTLLLLGLAVSPLPPLSGLQLPPSLILAVFLPVLLLHGAPRLDLAAVRTDLASVSLLVGLGVLVTTAAVGLIVHTIAGLSWGVALLCGAIVAPTDPSAVLALVGPLGAPRRLTTMVDAESLFNDGLALVLVGALFGMATSVTVTPLATMVRLLGAVVGALVLGVGLGRGWSLTLGRTATGYDCRVITGRGMDWRAGRSL
jgi:CPA1 family monovalent cation:H+ antiporter